MKRILITGMSGFLGRYVALSLKNHYQVLGTYHRHTTELDGCGSVRLDVADTTAVHAMLAAFRPDVIVHAAAFSDVDGCERVPEEADRVNVQGTACIAEGALAV